jgi:ribonuclease P protein component
MVLDKDAQDLCFKGMFSSKNRLRKKQEFENVYKKGRFSSYENITLKFVKNNLGYSRIGFVVSGKFSKKAVERNKIKRQLKNIFQKNLFSLGTDMDLIIIPQKKEKLTYQKLQENVEKSLKKAKIIN